LPKLIQPTFTIMKTILTVLLILFSLGLQAQSEEMVREERMALTVGILQGGGSLVGADLEVMATDRLGIQIGGGFVGYGMGLNYHLKPGPRSSALSLVYWHQGIGESFTQSVVGGTFMFRAKKLFTAQLGLGARLDSGPALPEGVADVPVMFLYSIGLYLAR
jgi:hypothetical protein